MDVYCRMFQCCHISFLYLIPCCFLSLFLKNLSKVEVNFMCTTVNNLNCSVPWNPVGASPQGYELSLFFSINGLLENLLKLVPL